MTGHYAALLILGKIMRSTPKVRYDLLLEKFTVQSEAIFCFLQGIFEGFHTLLQSGISCAKTSGFKCLKYNGENLESLLNRKPITSQFDVTVMK